jgi:hypothetical protein
MFLNADFGVPIAEWKNREIHEPFGEADFFSFLRISFRNPHSPPKADAPLAHEIRNERKSVQSSIKRIVTSLNIKKISYAANCFRPYYYAKHSHNRR